jgi:hypothetical protein
MFKVGSRAFWAKGRFPGRSSYALYGPKRKNFDPKSSCSFLTESIFRPEKKTFWVKNFLQFSPARSFLFSFAPSLLHIHPNISKMLQKS